MKNEFLSEFLKLPVIYKFDEFEVGNINILNRGKEIIDKFLFEYSEMMTDCLFNTNEDISVDLSIEKSYTYANRIMDGDDIQNFLENNFVN